MRSARTLIAVVLGLGMLVVPLAAAQHVHDGSISGHSCVVCTASHAPVVQAQPAPLTAGTVRLPGRVTSRVAGAFARFVPALPGTRAPPLA